MMEPRLEPFQREPDLALDLPVFDDEPTELDTLPRAAGPRRPWWRRRGVVVTLSIVLVVALLIVGVATVRAIRRAQVSYQYARVTQGTIKLTVNATGPVQGTIYNLNFSGSGTISEIDVTLGEQVTTGQVLAKLDPTSLQDAVAQAQAQVDAAQTALDNAYTNQSNVQAQTQAQVTAAYDQEQVSIQKCSGNQDCINAAESQYAQAQAQADAQNATATAQVNTAQAQLATAQAVLQTAQDNAANAVLVAPHAGTVAAINGAVGGAPGVPANGSSTGSGGAGGTVFIQIADLSSLQVVASVNESDIGTVALDQPVTFTVGAYTGKTFTGTVSAISPVGQTVSNVVTYPVTIAIDATSVQSARLLPGMTASVAIITVQRPGVLLVPASAVAFARTATNPTLGLFTASQTNAALAQANTLLTQVESLDPSSVSDNPQAALLIKQVKGKLTLVPVVLGISDGTVYEAITGVVQGDTMVSGAVGGPFGRPSGAATPGGFGGGRFGGGGLGG
ncbi:MAG TPA: efflux RND transporter periplasmic adaptor subunit [Ktedonobacterales bacterium]|jgi:multidrug efflux pump subunit AcrA (membrane-fusion protein)